MPINGFFALEELKTAVIGPEFTFTKGTRPLKIDCLRIRNRSLIKNDGSSRLYDLERDPEQMRPLHDPETEERMKQYMVKIMKSCDAPAEQYERLGL